MDLDTRIAAGYAADEERDQADQSRSDLERNSSLSSASRLDAIKDGININPDTKNNIMYRKITGHNVKFQGTLPSNKTKTFGIGDYLRSGWNYLTGQYRNIPNRIKEAVDPNMMDNYYNRMKSYYDRTGDLDIGNYFQSVGIDPRTLTPMQREAIEASVNALRNGTDLNGNPIQLPYGTKNAQNYKNYNNISDALVDKNTAANAQRWLNNSSNNGLTDKNKQQLYRKMHNDYYGLSPYTRQEQEITPEEMHEAQVDMRNQMLANQVNTYQNSLNQYKTHLNQYNDLINQMNSDNSVAKTELVKLRNNLISEIANQSDPQTGDPIKKKEAENQLARVSEWMKDLSKVNPDELNKVLGNKLNKAELLQLHENLSKLKGHQAMMNKANYDLRAQGLTGLTDNKDYDVSAGKHTVNVDGKDIELGGNDPNKSRFDEFRDDIKARYDESQAKLADLQSKRAAEVRARKALKDQLKKGVDANGNQLTPEAAQKLAEQINAYDKEDSKLKTYEAQIEDMQNNGMYRRVKTIYDNLGFGLGDARDKEFNTAKKQLADYNALQQQIKSGVDANGKQLSADQIKELTDKASKVDINKLTDTIKSYRAGLQKQQDIAKQKFLERSTANRRKNEVTDVNQFQAITGQNVDMMKDPKAIHQEAVDAYNNAVNEAKKNANITDDYNTWVKGLTDDQKKNLKLNTYNKKTKQYEFDQNKAHSYYNKNSFNESKFQQGAGKDLYRSVQEAAKAKQGYDPNAVKTIQSNGNGGFAYGTQQQHKQAQDKKDKMAKQLYDMTGYEYGVPTNDRNYHPLSKPQSLFSDRTIDSVSKFYSMTPAEKKNYAIKGGMAVGMGAAGVAIPYGYKKLTEDDDDDDGDDSFFSDRSRNSITRYYSNDELTRRNVYIDDEYTEPEEYYQGMGKPSYNTREDAKDEIIREASKYALGAGAAGLATYELYKHLFD